LFAILGLVGSGLWAQLQEPEAVFRTDTRLVILNASVFDAQGHMLTDLPGSAFRVYENGAPQQVKVFRREDAPISLGLVVDRSPSMVNKREKVASAALALVRASNRDDEVFVMNFDEDAYLDQDYTSDIAKLEKGLRNLDSSAGTAMRDALRLAVEHLKQRGKKDKKVVLVVTDGEDNSSRETLERLVRTAQQYEVIVYAVGLLGNEKPAVAARAKRDLDALTASTGGRAWYPEALAEVDSIASQIAHEIRNQYIIGYSPADQTADGSYRRIRVEVDAPGAVVRTRAGYYAMPEAADRRTPTGPR
jgi:Ca-activated chloride channel homolog